MRFSLFAPLLPYLLSGIGIIYLVTQVLLLNGGTFTYTLDDAYIHLALADQIAQGHYGLNANEVSAPASSILWPFLLVLFRNTSYFTLAPFILNIVFLFFTVRTFSTIATLLFPKPQEQWLKLGWICFGMIGTNLLAMVMNGMEHLLQLWLTLLLAQGLLIYFKEQKIPYWCWAVIVIAPFIRYENFSPSLAALGIFWLRGQRLYPALAAFLLLMIAGIFSAYLFSLGLSPLPSSVISKLPFTFTATSFNILLLVLKNILKGIVYYFPSGVIMIVVMTMMVRILKWPNLSSHSHQDTQHLSLFILAILTAHLLAGRYSFQLRHVVYVFALLWPLLTFLYKGTDLTHWWLCSQRRLRATGGLLVLLGSFLTYLNLTEGFILVPQAANNIYSQQYQMKRWAQEFYRNPVAVNDIGLVTLNNPSYVLDLYGLANHTALQYRLARIPGWMTQLVEKYQVDCALIYDSWFQHAIPKSWLRVGLLYTKGMRVSITEKYVSIYATNPAAAGEIIASLKQFRFFLPKSSLLYTKDDAEFTQKEIEQAAYIRREYGH